MDGERLDAAVLELLGKVDDNLRVVVPSKSGLNCNRKFHCIDDGACDFEHEGYVAEHACSCSFACHFLDRTAKVDVDDVRVCLLLYYLGCLDHRSDLATVNLYGNGAFFVANGYLLQRAVYHADKCIGIGKFGVDHRCPELFAEESECLVGHVLHRCEEHRTIA